MCSRIRVLHVDDEPSFTDLAATFLEREGDRIDVLTESTGAAALDRLRSVDDIDCVVSDHDLAETTGIDLLESVRGEFPDLPFILFTGKGSEEVASRAISAGVTDYLQKEVGTEQYEILANRIENAVGRFRSVQTATRRKRRLETLVSNLPGIVYRTHNDPEWPMEYVDGECEDLVGYTAEQLESGDVLWGEDVLHPNDRDEAWNAVQRAIERGEPFECTYRVVTAGGTVKSLWERGRLAEADAPRAPTAGEGSQQPTRALEGFITEVTAPRAHEQDLKRSERRFEAVFNDPNLLVAILDPEGTVLEINETALGFVDETRSEVVGEPFASTPWWQERQDDVDRWIDAAATGEYVEYEATHPTHGDPITVEGVFRPVVDADGTVTAIVVSARDVTEREARKQELRQQHERLDEFASFVSHDFQSPISTAHGRLELALETGDLEHVETALEAVERIDDLRCDLAGTLRSGDIVSESATVAVGEALERAWATSDPGPGASFSVAEPVEIRADPDAFQRILENLVSNSLEHGGESVRVRVGPLDGGADSGFYYEDDGPGIDPDARQQVFVPGFSTKASGDGTGLGMASVRQIVRAHGWAVDVHDAETLDGVRFEFRID